MSRQAGDPAGKPGTRIGRWKTRFETLPAHRVLQNLALRSSSPAVLPSDKAALGSSRPQVCLDDMLATTCLLLTQRKRARPLRPRTQQCCPLFLPFIKAFLGGPCWIPIFPYIVHFKIAFETDRNPWESLKKVEGYPKTSVGRGSLL